MKKSNLLAGFVYLLAGGLLLWAALSGRFDPRLTSLLCGFAGAGIGPGAALVGRYLYWSAPRNRARCEERLESQRIELHDELKEKLRDRAGRYAYLTGLGVLSLSIAVFAVLGQLGAAVSARGVVLFLGGVLVFEYAVGLLFYRRLCKKY